MEKYNIFKYMTNQIIKKSSINLDHLYKNHYSFNLVRYDISNILVTNMNYYIDKNMVPSHWTQIIPLNPIVKTHIDIMMNDDDISINKNSLCSDEEYIKLYHLVCKQIDNFNYSYQFTSTF